MGCYSDPGRDKRMHTISTVYIAKAHGIPCAADDAINIAVYKLDSLPVQLCFDHAQILADYAKTLRDSDLKNI
jgi:8-oxo-dGTP diphosphatase